MPTTRKKVIKTVYNNENDSDPENADFSDSGSDAVISQPSSSEEDEEIHNNSDNKIKRNKTQPKNKMTNKINIKALISKASGQRKMNLNNDEYDSDPTAEPKFSIKDLTDADKLLPSILNLSESDSSDDESPVLQRPTICSVTKPEEIETETETEYKDVWSSNLDKSEEIAQKAFLELEKHKISLEETKESIQKYTVKNYKSRESDVKDLLALGEELPSVSPKKIKKRKLAKAQNDSDSEFDDWEEVAESKSLPQQGLQLVVDFPDAACRKTKKVDVEMMMKRKINRVKKEYQVYMHKVHVLCWLGHGNYVSQVLNDQVVMSAALSLIPSKDCYPGERVDMKYVEQITTWFKDKLNVKYDKNEGKYRPKAPPLKNILLEQIKSRTVTSKKYIVFIFVSMLRAVGLQCRIMLNITTLPIKPPATELCSLSIKPKKNETSKGKDDVKSKEDKKKKNTTNKIPQIDGNYDSMSDSDFDNIMQLDGNGDDKNSENSKIEVKNKDVDVSSPKRPRRNLSIKKAIPASNKKTEVKSKNEKVAENDDISISMCSKTSIKETNIVKKDNVGDVSPPKRPRRNLSIKKAVPESIKKTEVKSKSKKVAENDDISISMCSKSPIKETNIVKKDHVGDVSPPKRPRRNLSLKKENSKEIEKSDVNSNNKNVKKATKQNNKEDVKGNVVVSQVTRKSLSLIRNKSGTDNLDNNSKSIEGKVQSSPATSLSLRKTINSKNKDKPDVKHININQKQENVTIPKVIITNSDANIASAYFDDSKIEKAETNRSTRNRKRSRTSNPNENNVNSKDDKKSRAKSAPQSRLNRSKYFDNENVKAEKKDDDDDDDSLRICHRDLGKSKMSPKSKDVTKDLVKIIKKRVNEAKLDTKKGKTNKSSDEDSDYLPEATEVQKSSSTKKLQAKPGTSRKIDRRVLSTDDELPSRKIDAWCEIYVEELEQWIAVDVIKGRVHCVNEIYSGATHPVNYIVGWDNNNYLKDLTRRYVPHWNTVTRKQRVEPAWWATAIQPWLGPKTARDREEDESLDRLQLDAPLPKSIAEYKNHPLYALKRHLLKFEAIYPPDAATLGFVRGEAVYARDCVYVCRSRDTWLKEAKVVRLGEKPYKVVKARPKWDKLSNKLITDKPLEVFGPWQVQDYEPPVAENGMVPRNAYGNVELFKDCMLPKGTVHIKLPGLNRVAKKLNIDCAPAMTGFDFNGGWSHPVYDGFVVCKEFEEIITNAWHEDQIEQERKEVEKLEARVYGNWRRLIKGLLIKERLKLKYGFNEPSTSQEIKKKATGPRLVLKKKCLDK